MKPILHIYAGGFLSPTNVLYTIFMSVVLPNTLLTHTHILPLLTFINKDVFDRN